MGKQRRFLILSSLPFVCMSVLFVCMSVTSVLSPAFDHSILIYIQCIHRLTRTTILTPFYAHVIINTQCKSFQWFLDNVYPECWINTIAHPVHKGYLVSESRKVWLHQKNFCHFRHTYTNAHSYTPRQTPKLSIHFFNPGANIHLACVRSPIRVQDKCLRVSAGNAVMGQCSPAQSFFYTKVLLCDLSMIWCIVIVQSRLDCM